jgi:hypothetical protein
MCAHCCRCSEIGRQATGVEKQSVKPARFIVIWVSSSVEDEKSTSQRKKLIHFIVNDGKRRICMAYLKGDLSRAKEVFWSRTMSY